MAKITKKEKIDNLHRLPNIPYPEVEDKHLAEWLWQRQLYINSLLESIDQMLAHLQTELVVRWLIAIIGLLIALGGMTYSLAQNHNTARQAQQTAQALTLSRAQGIYDNCVTQKHNNTATVKQLRQDVSMAIKNHPTQRAVLLENFSATKALINDLLPIHNCATLKQQALHP